MNGLVAAPAHLAELVAYQEGAVVSRTLIDAKMGTVTLFAFDEGQRLSEHTALVGANPKGSQTIRSHTFHCLVSVRLMSRPNEGCSRLPVIVMGRTAPAPFFLNKGSTAFRRKDLIPVVVSDTLASRCRVPRKSSCSLRRP